MDVALIPHPLHPPRAIMRVEVEVKRASAGRLELRYRLFGEMDDLLLAPPAPPLRTDNLWRTTCFEAFFARPGAPAYREFNFSPSSEWAAYDFRSYRDPERADAPLAEPPVVTLMPRRAERLVLNAGVATDLGRASWRLGLSAILEETDGTKSYWALAHPDPARPDFHHPDCFAFQLPALGEA